MSKRASASRDIDIRVALVQRLLNAGIARDCIRHEITLDSSSSDGRADLVVLRPSAIVGVEIKSGVDTLARLAIQRPRYSARFDRIVIVCDEKHSPWKAEHGGWQGWECCSCRSTPNGIEFSEDYWSGMGALLSPEIKCGERSGHLSSRAMLEMLWAAEIGRISGHGTRSAGIPSIAEITPLRDVRAAVSAALRARQPNRWEERFWAIFDAQGIEARSDETRSGSETTRRMTQGEPA